MPLRYFGTDGIRGTFGEPPLDVPSLRRLGFALARSLQARRPGTKFEIVAGRDPRVSGPEILAAVAEGPVSLGHHVRDLGVLPTPAVSEAVQTLGADIGVMITASHNPPSDNGVKLFDERGLKLDEAAEAELEAWIDRVRPPETPAPPAQLPARDVLDDFRRRRAALLPAHALAGWAIAVDCAHGATCATTPEVLRALGATVHLRAGEPDGARINDDCGSEHPQGLASLVRERGARLGIAHDGDGDRLIVCDETGSLVDGDQILGVLALHALREKKLPRATVVATVQSNLGLDHAVAGAGGRVERAAVGDRNVLHKLLELGATLGGENSGHYLFLEHARCGDGLLAALMLIEVLRATDRPLSQLRREVPLLPQLTANILVQEKRPLEELPAFGAALAAAEKSLAGRGRVLARYSGTERKLRLLVEGPDANEVARHLAALKAAAAQELGASITRPPLATA